MKPQIKFLAGLALGAMGVARMRRAWTDEFPAVRWFAVAQACLTALPLALLVCAVTFAGDDGVIRLQAPSASPEAVGESIEDVWSSF